MREYKEAQNNRILVHSKLRQSVEDDDGLQPITFVVCADTQIGMYSDNKEWETELVHSRVAIRLINELTPRPKFCCVCGDLTDMEHTFWKTQEQAKLFTKEQCDEIQVQQRKDFQTTWSTLHEDIALVCVCGNHDVGNRPTKDSLDKFKDFFGDDYLAFWSSRYSYNIVVNTNLFSNPSGALDLYAAQLKWLEERLNYAQSNNATSIFVFGHHPWFLYREDEEKDSMPGICAWKHWRFPDNYFHIPKEYRMPVMDLFRKFNVTAAFSGHFHQNHLAQSSFGMEMIITSSLSEVFVSSGKPKDFAEPNSRGVRIVKVNKDGTFDHKFVSLPESDDAT
ncbi:MAG: hypothetical protein SGILL_005305, partial [Bacillariaceae sp.]